MPLTSFLQVIRYQQRYLLIDGYHRAYGLLRKGIHVVPALVREFGPHEDPRLTNRSMFSAGVFLGERPPLLPDYADDIVAADTQLPAVETLIVINGVTTTLKLEA